MHWQQCCGKWNSVHWNPTPEILKYWKCWRLSPLIYAMGSDNTTRILSGSVSAVPFKIIVVAWLCDMKQHALHIKNMKSIELWMRSKPVRQIVRTPGSPEDLKRLTCPDHLNVRQFHSRGLKCRPHGKRPTFRYRNLCLGLLELHQWPRVYFVAKVAKAHSTYYNTTAKRLERGLGSFRLKNSEERKTCTYTNLFSLFLHQIHPTAREKRHWNWSCRPAWSYCRAERPDKRPKLAGCPANAFIPPHSLTRPQSNPTLRDCHMAARIN